MINLADIPRRARLKRDFSFYAEHALKIRTKDARIAPLVLNTAQQVIHAAAEDQMRRTGRVRKLVLKGRQQGCSTYIGARFYHQMTHRPGVRAFILTHEMDATENLFGMTERFHGHCPPEVRPAADRDSAKELRFAALDSSYGIGTAGSKSVGRSQTIQLFHGSEVAFWPNAENHMAGVMQAVPDGDGTEVWLESTANGVGNWFHAECMKAVAGRSSFEFLFVPWFWQSEYRLPLPSGFKVSADENVLIDLYGLDGKQLAWRRNKIATLGEQKFKQEYPHSPEEAFAVSGEDVLIGSELVRAAFGRAIGQVPAPVVWGLDPSRFGDDRKTLAKRRGNTLLEPIKVLLPNMPAGPQSDTQALAGAVIREFDLTARGERPRFICVDAIGVGAGAADALRAANLAECEIIDVNVSEAPSADERFMTLRDELWWSMREWFEDRGCSTPDDEALVTELAAVTYNFSAAGRIKVESKKDMKKRLGFSPDKADALMLTFKVAGANPAKRAPIDAVGSSDRRAGY